MKKIILGVFVSAVMFGQTAQAVTLSAVDSGVFINASSSGGIGAGTSVSHNSNATAIDFTFSISGFVNIDSAAFAIFDLSGVSGAVTGASLEMVLSNNAIGLGGPGSFVFNQVSSDPAVFNSSYNERSNCGGFPCDPLGPGRDIYLDLSSGPALGAVSYTGVGAQTVVLGSGGLDLLNLTLGGLLVVAIDSAGGNGLGRVTFAAPQLTLEVAAVPVPGAGWLFGTALVGLVGFGRRASVYRCTG